MMAGRPSPSCFARTSFQDGTPFNAAVVKWNFDRMLTPAFKGGTALNHLSSYQTTDVINDSTVRVHFSQPSVPFLTYAGSPASTGRLS
jgi:peptide/nickel transport system substrate-binding protein